MTGVHPTEYRNKNTGYTLIIYIKVNNKNIK